MGMLRVGPCVAEIPDDLLELASTCCYLDQFRCAEGPTAPVLRVRRVEALQGPSTPLDGSSEAGGSYAVQGQTVLVSIPPSPASAEASLRAVLQIATLRQGGLLVHGSGVAFGGKAAIAVGPSGAGKSTLARLCIGAGGQLLSDETVGLYPDGTVWGSPFFSDPDLACQLDRASLSALLLLEKGSDEHLAPVGALEGITGLLSQAYRPAFGEVTPSELLARGSALALQPGVHRLRFRKEPVAGAFVKRWMLERSA